MTFRWLPVLKNCALLALTAGLFAFQRPAGSAAAPLADPFATGWMLADTNNDGLADFVNGKIVVPAEPSATENAAAADLAARIGYMTTGLTLPVVVTAASDGPRIFVGKGALPSGVAAELGSLTGGLSSQEGGVFAVGGNIAIVANDDKGLLAAAEAYASRAPYQWKVPGDPLSAIAAAVAPGAELAGVTYKQGTSGIYRALLRSRQPVTIAVLSAAFATNKLSAVRELVVIGAASPVAIMNPKALPAEPVAAAAAPAPASGGGGGDQGAPKRLDLATLYSSRGLFNGTARMPLPSTLDARLYVPAGAAGIAMANLAARMGLETIGLTLPLATPAPDATSKDVRAQAVIAGDSALAKEAETKLRVQDPVAAEAMPALAPGEGEVRLVDSAFGRNGALLTRGDAAGSAAALDLLSHHFPNLWEPGKPYLSLEEIRYDLHRFFSQRSAAGQAAAGLYWLDRWLKEIGNAPVKDVKTELFADLADPGLVGLIRGEVQRRLHTSADVRTGSLHAGTQCCDHEPSVHYQGPLVPFKQGQPSFSEDLVIPWEGTRLLDAVRHAAPRIRRNSPIQLIARVSESPEQRHKLQTEIEDLLKKAGADPKQMHVTVLCAYKQGYSWLMDEVAPRLGGRPVSSIRIDFAKNVDPTGERVMFSPARWVQELYPVDEMLARKLSLPLDKIALNQVEVAGGPTYRVHAFDASGAEIYSSDFTVATVLQPYNGVMARYEQVQVATGWVRLDDGGKVLLEQRIKTDPEEFWDHYQNVTLPKVFHAVMAQSEGDLRPEFAPPFDTIRIDLRLSEPDYSLDLDKERISSLEALQEDTFYSTENFVNMMGNLEAGRAMNYVGRIIPVVHRGEDGKDGRVHIEFYAKPAAHPLVRLSWTDAQGHRQERERNLPALTGEMQPRLIQARVKSGEYGVESLTWLLPADYLEDRYDDWLKVEGQDQVDRTIFSVERARGQLHWLETMHAAGLYRDDIAYPHLKRMAMEFELPVPLSAKPGSTAPRAYAAWAVTPPATARPMIADFADKSSGAFQVQWDEPIGPEENTRLLAKLGTFPGVTVYWMGRSYLGQNMWGADIMLPSPAALRSRAKETTLKAVVVYSGRQHANEVSSTSHILKLGEQLINDPETRAMLKQVNVCLHPIDNSDGAELSMDLAKMTPDNMLHPGYHGSLGADVVAGQSETDPVYPESRTRRQLLEEWLPDAFLNPHGYPSHEWVQPFSEYTGWVQTREGANPGRAWWIPRGWFTSLTYLRDVEHPDSMRIAYALRDRIVDAERAVPGLLPLEERMNARYERFGQRWQPRNMYQPIVNGIRIYMALKGSPARGAGGAGGGAQIAGGGGTGGMSPDITWDSGYTEAPDETAHGEYLKLLASAGLAFDRVHLKYLAEGKLRITRTERESGGAVQWRVDRARPVLPFAEPANANPANDR